MNKTSSMFFLRRVNWRLLFSITALSFLVSASLITTADAFEVYEGSDWKVNWDTTLKYSAAWRIAEQDGELTGLPNADDGDRNFDEGLISNRLDVLTELDITYRNFGLRVSAAGWADSEYLNGNDNDSPETFNGTGENDEFNDDTEELHGLNLELLDAFVFGRGKLGKFPVSVRLGRHTSLWGETLFFASNGIAHAQAPIDVIKANTVPGTQAKELFMPVGQLSAQIQLTNKVSLNAYMQYEWRRSRMCAAGSYCSDADMIDAGGERILPGIPLSLYRSEDLGAGDPTSEFGDINYDNYGLGLRFRVEKLDTDFGLYYVHFNENLPYWIYMDTSSMNPAAGKLGDYYMVYPKNIRMFGLSFGTQVGQANVSGEISERFDAPLVSSGAFDVTGTGDDNDENPAYAQGNSFHANLSAIYLFGPCALWDGGNVLGEVGYTFLHEITENEAAADPSRDDWALGFRMVFEPSYFQVVPGIDIGVPIGLGYNVGALSPVDLKFNGGGADHGGDFSIGLNIDYLGVWRFGIKYTDYFGEDPTQTLRDRDFISVSVRRTF